MELYYTNKEKLIHTFLSENGWSDEEIHKAMFDITKWTAVTLMPIEIYYKRVMQRCSYEEYKEFIAITEPENYLRLKHKYTRNRSTLAAVVLLLLAVLFTLLKNGG